MAKETAAERRRRRQQERQEITRATERTRAQVYMEYAWLMALISSDTTGSLQGVFDWVIRQYEINNRRTVPMAQPFTEAQLEREINNTEWRRNQDSIRAQAEIDRQRFPQDWERSITDRRLEIQNIAQRYGIQIPDAELDRLALEARLNGWSDADIRQRLEPFLDETILRGEDLIGDVGDFETRLMQWVSRNGLQLSRDALAKYLSNLTLGRQSFEDVQADIRRTYLAGAFPAWADKINEGFDPIDLFEPYINLAKNLLELDDIGFDDPLIKRFTQGMGADGNPTKMPLWQFENEIRKDPRWQQTDNAYKLYTNVGTDLLRMFGFR